VNYDLFICHASEDKESFVRPLADALKGENVEVWYDEFSLKLGDSIRRSLDKGLKQSRFGLVVLSKAFFEKKWPQYELDGLAEREMCGRDKIILPVWHGIRHDEILAYSPSLAGRKAVSSGQGLRKVVDEILDVLRPQGSPLIAARDALLEWGVTPPVITDEYWLGVVEASNRLPGFGANIPEESTWSRWSFPLPPKGETAQSWGERLAWTALQQKWVHNADEIPICPTTPTDRVLCFIDDHPGLPETCETFPRLLAEYAPQLTIPGLGGQFEIVFEEEYKKSCAEYARRREQNPTHGTALTVNSKSPLCDEEWCLRDKAFGNYSPTHLANEYFHGGMFGPSVAYFEDPDHAFWLLSKASHWLPTAVHKVLLKGMSDWITWPWGYIHGNGGDWKTCGVLSEAMFDAVDGKEFQWNDDSRDDVWNRIQLTITRMKLPETVDEIFDRFLRHRFIEKYVRREKYLRQCRSGSRAKSGAKRKSEHAA
jgi:hypothetical protein